MGVDQLRAWIPAGGVEEALLGQIVPERLPRHVAIIMDGNGRWAQQRQKSRVEGHRAGVAAVRDTIETAARLGLEVLTLYAFSVENWKRPEAEVATLMGLLRHYLRAELGSLLKNQIRFRVVGRPEALAPDIREELVRAEEKSAAHRGLQLNVALNYGGRTEIVDAARSLLAEVVRDGRDPAAIGEEDLARHLYTKGQPDPDLLIRTSGEMRISNFLLWQIAYSEIWVTDVFWPDFRRRHLLQAILDFQKRERRYGGIGPA